MRDYLGHHVTSTNQFGSPDACDAAVGISVHGSFAVSYAEHIDKVCLKVDALQSSTFAGMSMQLSVEKAIALRDLLDAGIDDALAATSVDEASVLELPSGGAA
ncbi:hypothetical protein [Nocardia goodfellowii]|uniref:Uncharacterized protein n=1 Tax=Nocardia goodfellowii TaxID=882446 RepID=A0ABS4QPG0_9NOCA|nr:hypothetical protein [Nocardia goodfellowii]MBP2193594.1 hypothetical protein [Nocardia goodfellowii]